MSLTLLLSACTSTNATRAASAQFTGDSPTVIVSAKDFLILLSDTVNLQTSRIQLPPIARLGFDLSEAEERAASFFKANALPSKQNGIVAIAYSREPKLSNQYQGMQEQLIITLQPQLVCIDVATVQSTWQSQMQSGHLTPIVFGLGKLNPADGLNKDKIEQTRRGNGPIEMIIKVKMKTNRFHQASFSFYHQFHKCARSVTLTTWSENK